MVVEALYTNGVVCTITGYTVSPMSLTDNVTTVIVSFAEAGIIRTVGQEVAVLPILAGIEIASAPDKTQYFYLESFDSTGMVVNAIYSNGFKESVPGFTCQETTFNAIGTHEVIISYTKDGITKLLCKQFLFHVFQSTCQLKAVHSFIMAVSKVLHGIIIMHRK